LKAYELIEAECNKCGSSPICDYHVFTRRYTATCGNVDCKEHDITDGEKVTRLQALQAWNKRQSL
jgi:hypothetical protein